MKKWLIVSALAVFGCGFFFGRAFLAAPGAQEPQQQAKPEDTLVVLWQSGDPEVFHHALHLFALNAKRFQWFKTVNVIVWGPAQKLLARDADIQKKVARMKSAGVIVLVDVDCARDYDLEAALRSLGYDVTMIGPRILNPLKAGQKVLSF